MRIVSTDGHSCVTAKALALCFLLLVGSVMWGCSRVDQKKFDAVYRAGKAIEVDLNNSIGYQPVVSEQLLKQLQTEASLLDGRTSGRKEAAALRAYLDAAEADKHYLDIWSINLQVKSVEGRLLLGEGWVAVASKYGFDIEASDGNNDPTKTYKFFWVKVSPTIETLGNAVKKSLTEASRQVNGQS